MSKPDLFWAARNGDVVLLLELIRNRAKNQVGIDAVSSEGCTALFLAALHGHVDALRILLDSGASVSTKSIRGFMPLHVAATPQIVLVAHGADVTDTNTWGCTPLHIAALSGKLDTVKALLEAVATTQLDTKDFDGYSALGLAVSEGHVDVAQCLLLAGANVNVIGFKVQAPGDLVFQDTVLQYALRKGSVAMVQLLLSHGADVHVLHLMGTSAMQQACMRQTDECKDQCLIVQMLVDRGADINAKDDKGTTPLMCALHGDRPDLVFLLLSCGADVASKSNQGQTALHFAAGNMHSNLAMYGLSTALTLTGMPSVKIVAELIQRGADVKAADDEGTTALHFAAYGQRTDMAELLLSHGADVNARGAHGATPLYLACSNPGWRLSPSVQLFVSHNHQEGPESSDMVKLLLSQGADVNIVTLKGEEALQNAVFFNKSLQNAELLLEHGADASNRDIKGQTALHTAAGWGCPGSVSLLLQHGTDRQALFKGDNCLHYAAQGLRLEAVKRSESERDRPSEDMLGCNAAGFDAELARFSALLSELLSHGFDLEAKSTQGRTALHIAIESGHSELVEIFLSHGVRTDAVYLQGCTPLHTAAAQGQAEALRLLLRHGADISVTDDLGKTALHHAAASGSVAKLHLKHNESHIAEMVDPQGFNYLQVTVECIKNADCVKTLLDHGADLATMDHAGMTPLHAANGSAAEVIVMLGGSIYIKAPTSPGVVAGAHTAIRNLGCCLQRIFRRL